MIDWIMPYEVSQKENNYPIGQQVIIFVLLRINYAEHGQTRRRRVRASISLSMTTMASMSRSAMGAILADFGG